MRYSYAPFGYTTPPELSGKSGFSAPVIICGAGPIGLAMAIDLAQHDIASIVLDDNDVVSVGSRAICWAKRTLEIFDRLGVGERMLAKGVTWKVGRLFSGDQEIYNFDLLPEDGHKFPAFINLQQYYVEQYLVERVQEFPGLINLRFKNKVTGLDHDKKGVTAHIDTPDGPYRLTADYLLACDGAGSTVRESMNLEMTGRGFEERFLIADIEMTADFPPERWFWFKPTFHKGQSALLHKQPDNIYRIDLQLGADADADEEKKSENVIPRIKRMLEGRPFEIDWVSVYTFGCRHLNRFVYDRVVFVGDSAHVVSPFGARGGNGGIHDVDNLGWKLAAVIKGNATEELIESYNQERTHGAQENVDNSARTTRFMSPESQMEHLLRDAALDLARDHDFARRLINSGRLSVPCSLAGMSLQSTSSANSESLPPQSTPGLVAPDAPIQKNGRETARGLEDEAWLLRELGGDFVLLAVATPPPPVPAGVRVLSIDTDDTDATDKTGKIDKTDKNAARDHTGKVFERYGTGLYLIRPDQYIAARWTSASAENIAAAHARACGKLVS